MEENNKSKSRIAEGYAFYMEEDAELAVVERKKIEYLDERMNYSQPESILRIYDRAIRERVFKTPVGIMYLKKLQDYLMKQESIEPEQILPIPLFQTYGGTVRDRQNPTISRIKPPEEKKSPVLPISIVLNILLAFAIIAMFIVTLNADQPNVLNYERVLTNRYASWEQELTEREQVIREKERELHIETQ